MSLLIMMPNNIIKIKLCLEELISYILNYAIIIAELVSNLDLIIMIKDAKPVKNNILMII